MRNNPLRRTLLSAAATVSGIALLLALKPHEQPATGLTVAPAPADPTVAAQSPSPARSKQSARPTAQRSPTSVPSRSRSARPTASTSPPTRRPTTTTVTVRSTPEPAAGGPSTVRTVTGSTAQTDYGPVQVQITLSGHRITAASAVRAPDDTARSRQLSAEAIPKLNQETLAAQSADIDTVSGATYTSQGYRQSLQSALDQAGG